MSRQFLCHLAVLCLIVRPALPADAPPVQAKPRVIILTDIGNEPDDSQSMVRFLVMSNEFDVEGLIATTGCWLPDQVNPEMIHERIDAYEQVFDNLRVHDEDYPTAEALRKITKTGNAKYGMRGVGDDQSTEASRHIIEVVDREDPRPVWVCAWGGAVDLAQALWDVRKNRSPEEVARFIKKLRVYDIAGQDDCGAWAAHTFPKLIWLRSVDQFKGISPDINGHNKQARGGDESVITPEWTRRHVQSIGPLGALYPDTAYKTEGDTPSFLYLFRNGLSDPEHWNYGSWGGRFTETRQKNPDYVARRSGRARDLGSQEPYEPFAMFTGAKDTVTIGETTYRDNLFAPIFRWRTAYQNDLAARMQWTVTPEFDEANHPPQPVLNHQTGIAFVHIEATPGETVTLSADGSSDPDDDQLEHRWFIYPEPGTAARKLSKNAGPKTTVTAKPGAIHVILKTTDSGTPPLTRYRRAIIKTP